MTDPAIQAWHREDELRAKLRRLHEEIALQKALVAEAQEMAIKLSGANQELLETLQAWLPGAEAMGWNTDRARAAIAKHGGA